MGSAILLALFIMIHHADIGTSIRLPLYWLNRFTQLLDQYGAMITLTRID